MQGKFCAWHYYCLVLAFQITKINRALLYLKSRFYKLLTLVVVLPYIGFAQNEDARDTSTFTQIIPLRDTTATDSLMDASVLQNLVNYDALDSMAIMVAENKAYLYNKAHIDYGDITLEAGYIELDWVKNEVYARGILDSNGNVVQRPIFKQGEDTYETDEIRYNFSSNKAVIKAVITKEGEAFLHGSLIKRVDENTFYVKNTSFTTCNKRHPHFAVTTGKAKVISGSKIVTGPANLVIMGVPTPIFLPFGYFPAQDRRASGFIMPTYSTHLGKGLGLVGGGYYFNISEYVDLSLTGEVYSRGGFGVRANTNYKKRYKFNGNFDLRYNNTKIGDPRFEAYGGFQQSKDFRVRWSHRQDPKARPDFTFSASVDLANPTFNRFNTTNASDFLQNTTTSSISIDKRWSGSPFSLTASAYHTQNNIARDFTLSLPKVAFTMTRIFPFAQKNRVGSSKWYERIGVNYSANTEARITSNYDSINEGVVDFRKQIQTGVNNSMNISTNERILKFISFSPSIQFSSRWYPSRLNYSYDSIQKKVVSDTISGFSTVNTFSASATLSTKVYGTFKYRKGPIRAIRHMMTPQVGFRYAPDFADENFGIYQRITDTTGATQLYNRFNGYLYGSAGQGMNGSITFGLGNNFEAKVRDNKDSTGERKIKLLDRLNLNTSYNLAAEEFNWAPLSMVAQSSILNNKVQLTYQGTYDFYGYDTLVKKRVNRFASEVNGVLARNTRTNFSVNTRWSGKFGSENESKKNTSAIGIEENDPDYYSFTNLVDFSMPWSIGLQYNYQIAKPDLVSRVSTHSLGIDVKLDPTANWHVMVTSGYDLVQKEFTFTTLDLSRDLHCWELHIRWVPFGFQQSYMIGLNIKAASFKDAKVERRRNLGDF